MRHHAIIVTSWDEEAITRAWAESRRSGCDVSDIVLGAMNGYRSFLVVPDGSKEGWEHSDIGDANRARLIDWLDAQREVDGSSRFDWVEVQYGDDNGDNRVLRTDDSERPLSESAIAVFETYSVGLCCASVCTNLSNDEATRRLNLAHPTGIAPWELSSDATFASGQPHPNQCEQRDDCRHLLFTC